MSLVHRIFDQAFNQGDLSSLDELFAVDSIAHVAGWGVPASRTGLKQMIASLRTAFPDLYCTVEDEVYAGGRLAARWRMRGTHSGLFLGSQPTGRPVEVQGIIFAHTAGERIAENWIMLDQMGILQQIGIIPPSRGNL